MGEGQYASCIKIGGEQIAHHIQFKYNGIVIISIYERDQFWLSTLTNMADYNSKEAKLTMHYETQ